MQTLIIAGNVGKDAVLRRTQNGDHILGFALAVDNGRDKNGNDRPPTWYDCSVFGKRGEALESHVKKGTKLVLQGRPTARAHDGKAYLGIAVDDLTFMGQAGSKSEGDYGSSSGRSQPKRDSYGSQPANFSNDMNDDVPFFMEWR